MRARHLISALLIFALVASACGDEDGADDTTATTGVTNTTVDETDTTAEDTATTEAPPQPPAGAEIVPFETRCGFDSPDECDAVDAYLDGLPEIGTDDVCLVVPNEVVTPAHPDLVAGILDATNDFPGVLVADTRAELPTGLTLLSLTDGSAATEDIGTKVAAILSATGIPAAPHYVVAPTPKWKWGPGNGAVPVPPRIAGESVPEDGAPAPGGPRVTVIDTGYPDAGITFASPSLQPSGQIEPGTLDPHFQGHGLFVAGIVRQISEDAEIVMRAPYAAVTVVENEDEDTAFVAPLATESAVWLEMEAAIAQELKDGGVINISGGTYACDKSSVPLILAAATGEAGSKGVVVVASAGNDERGQQFDPAAGPPTSVAPADIPDLLFPAGFAFEGAIPRPGPDWNPDDCVAQAMFFGQQELSSELEVAAVDTCQKIEGLYSVLQTGPPANVVSVGAMDVWKTSVAGFSNRPATHWAPGVNTVSLHIAADWPVGDNGISATGAAQWDGTSFAAPYMAGLLAQNTTGSGYLTAATQLGSLFP